MPPRGAAGPACLPGMHMRVKAEHRGSQGKWSDGSYLVICDSDKNHTTAHAGMTTLHYPPELGSFPIMPYAFLSVAGDPRRCPVCKFHSSTAGKNCVCQCLTLWEPTEHVGGGEEAIKWGRGRRIQGPGAYSTSTTSKIGEGVSKRERDTHPHAREVIHMHKSQQRVIEMIKYFFPSFVSPLHFLFIGIHIFQLKKNCPAFKTHLKRI